MIRCFLFVFCLCFVCVDYGYSSTKKYFLRQEKDLEEFCENIKKPPKQWMLDQIKRDFSDYDIDKFSRKALDNYDIGKFHPNALKGLIKFNIKDGELSHSYGITPSTKDDYIQVQRNSAVEDVIEYLHGEFKLPDMKFFVFTHDRVDNIDMKLPVLCISKDKNCLGVLIPDFIDTDVLKKNFRYLLKNVTHSISAPRIEASSFKRIPWNEKKDVIFWRGSTSDKYPFDNVEEFFVKNPRAVLVNLAFEYPSVINAMFTHFWSCNDTIRDYLKKSNMYAERVPIFSHFYYKYLMSIDGLSAAFARVCWILFSNSVLLKQESDDIQWFYGAINPYEHYVPVKNDMSDVLIVYKWLRENDDKAMKIAENANEFAENNLLTEHLYQYFYNLLLEYAKIQNSSEVK